MNTTRVRSTLKYLDLQISSYSLRVQNEQGQEVKCTHQKQSGEEQNGEKNQKQHQWSVAKVSLISLWLSLYTFALEQQKHQHTCGSYHFPLPEDVLKELKKATHIIYSISNTCIAPAQSGHLNPLIFTKKVQICPDLTKFYVELQGHNVDNACPGGMAIDFLLVRSPPPPGNI